MSTKPSSSVRWLRRRSVQFTTLALLLAGGMMAAFAIGADAKRTRSATARLDTAAERLSDLTDGTPADDHRRVAIAWGYAQRLRLGLESPFRLIESAARDPRLTSDERRTVAWALLAHVIRGESHVVDPAALDGFGTSAGGQAATGEHHLALIQSMVTRADDPRAAELAVRFAYTLASAERVVDASAPILAASVAAMLADRELAKREAVQVVRSAGDRDPIVEIRRRRSRRGFYVERPVLLAANESLERRAIALSVRLLDSLRAMTMDNAPPRAIESDLDGDVALAPRLYAAGAQVPPVGPLAVIVKGYLPLVRAQAPRLDDEALARVRNTEMLVAATRLPGANRLQRRTLARLLLSAGVSMRSLAQQPVWFAGDSAPSAREVAALIGVSRVAFDHDVPGAWRPFFLKQLSDGVADLRRVFPGLELDAMQVRFRMTSPASSALAMHDPRTRTLHLPVYTAAGTLTHEIAHDLDRQQAQAQGHAGYRSDFVARNDVRARSRSAAANTRQAASLLALTEEMIESPRSAHLTERPAEIFATRVDWFVAQALASMGLSSGFLTAVQDEMLTGHVVHPSRLRAASRSRSLITALEGMTTVASFATLDREPSIYTLLRWSLGGPVDRGVAAGMVRGAAHAWSASSLSGSPGDCRANDDARVTLVRMAAESRARGWLRLRAQWTTESRRPAWARSALGQGPWSDSIAERLVPGLRDYILIELSSTMLPTGLPAYAAPLAARAQCGDGGTRKP